MKKLVFTVVALMSLGYGYAQDSTVPMATLTPAQPIEPAQKVEEKVEIKSVGRIHFDSGVLGANNYHNQFVSGIALADFSCWFNDALRTMEKQNRNGLC